MVEPATTTPEVFNPLNPSPTPSGSDLPMTCQVTDLNVYIDRTAGYCYAYPKRFTYGSHTMFNVPAVQGPAIGGTTDSVFTTFTVEVVPADSSRSLDQQVDQFLREFTVAAPESLTRARLTVGGEPAVMVDNVPVQLSWRLVFVPHNGQLYRLKYWPVDLPEAKNDLEELYQTTLNSFAFPPVQSETSSFAGLETTYGVLTLVVPPGIASGASGQEYPPITDEDAAYWQKTPGHLQVMLGDYYVLKDKSQQPVIYVYPAQTYAELVPAAFESIHRLNNILGNPGAPIDPNTLPAIPFFNARQVFASQIEVVSFQNGKGVRFLTEYAQYPASANNADLFYNFIGVTNDGAYYIVAVLPLTHPNLAETSDGGAVVPSDGIPYDYFSNPNADMMLYYTSVVQLLNSASPDAFTPTIGQLDLLVQSMQVVVVP
jgi:hypothetical protein